MKLQYRELDDETLEKIEFEKFIDSTKIYKFDLNRWREYERGSKKSCYHRIGDYYPYTIIDRVCEKFLNQSFDDAFSYYCKFVPKYQQKWFLDRIKDRLNYNHNYYLNPYTVVDNKIQKTNSTYKKPTKKKQPKKDYYEKLTQQRKKEKLWKQSAKEKAYSFLSDKEINEKKSKQQDLIKIEAHGFDIITSFRNEKQTNPDLIKIKQ